MDIWETGTLNQLFIRVSYNHRKSSKKGCYSIDEHLAYVVKHD